VIALLRDALDRFGEVQLRVTGSSMLPAIWPGDVVTIAERHLADVRPGEVAAFARGGRLFVHRVVSIDGDHLVTQGDTVPSADAPVSPADLLGVVAGVSRQGRAVRGFLNPGPRARLVSVMAARSSHFNKLVQRLHAMCCVGSWAVTS